MKSFEEIYENICENSKDEIHKASNKHKITMLGIVLGMVLLNLVVFKLTDITTNFNVSSWILPFISIIVVIIINQVQRVKYRRIFKELVIRPIVKELGKNLEFDSKQGMTSSTYRSSGLRIGSYDRFGSEDKIYGQLDDGTPIEFSEIVTEKEERTRDAEGNTSTTYTKTFQGIFGRVRLDNVFPELIKLEPNSNFSRFNKSRVEVDSAEFEKYFDLFANDRVMAMRIFTSDVIQKYLDFVDKTSYYLELIINGEFIYFRINCGSMFEPPMLKDPLNKEFLKTYYNLLFYPIEVLKGTTAAVKQIWKEEMIK